MPVINLIELYQSYRPIYFSDLQNDIDLEKPYSCTSQICNYSFFEMPFFIYWGKKLMPCLIDSLQSTHQCTPKAYKQPIIYHRKLWEWVYICQALYERGFLKPHKKGLTFGVGEECLPDLFASFGCEILATDLSSNDADAKGWMNSGQNAGGNLDKLNKYNFCEHQKFKKKVKYRDVNMNDIPADIKGYDFCWSACALEHLGSLRHGIEFIKNSLKTLRGGGAQFIQLNIIFYLILILLKVKTCPYIAEKILNKS